MFENHGFGPFLFSIFSSAHPEPIVAIVVYLNQEQTQVFMQILPLYSTCVGLVLYLEINTTLSNIVAN